MDEARIRMIEQDNMWQGVIEKELKSRLRATQPATEQTRRRPTKEALIGAVRNEEELKRRIATDPSVRAQLRALRDRVRAIEAGTESDASHRFLNDNTMASNAHMLNQTRAPLPPPLPGKVRIDYRDCDKTSLWCASFQMAMI
jgi:hypothetical protein